MARIGVAEVVLCVAIAIGCAESAKAQTQPVVGKAIQATEDSRARLRASMKNLAQMQGTLPSAQAETASAILDFGDKFRRSFSEAVTVGMVFSLLKSAPDIEMAGSYFRNSCAYAMNAADGAVQGINSQLPVIENAATLSEATKIRDAIAEIRSLFGPAC
jgi:hypothetical protein